MMVVRQPKEILFQSGYTVIRYKMVSMVDTVRIMQRLLLLRYSHIQVRSRKIDSLVEMLISGVQMPKKRDSALAKNLRYEH